jgi:hypothetical protein
MSRVLRRFTQACASMTVAVYEPLISNWVSGATLYTTAHHLVRRAYTSGRIGKVYPTAVKGLMASQLQRSDVENSCARISRRWWAESEEMTDEVHSQDVAQRLNHKRSAKGSCL